MVPQGNFSFGLGMGVGIEIRLRQGIENPALDGELELHVFKLELEFLGKQRNLDITV